MTIDPYRPVPWETFTLVQTAGRRSKAVPVLTVLALIAIVTGGLIALSGAL